MSTSKESPADGYESFYRDFDSPLMRQIRREAYGEDIGQHSWVDADELRGDIQRLVLSPSSRFLDLGCGPCGPLTFMLSAVGCRGTGVELSPSALQVGRASAASLGIDALLSIREADLNESLPFDPHSTLVDLSPGMLEVSRALNPECEHVQGDMRTVRLGREFDCVFIHDAIVYMTTEADLRRALETAFAHCRPGGAAIFAPDHVRETFSASTDHGGHDGGGRGLRYLEWTWDPDPGDTTYTVDYAYLLRSSDGSVHVEHDRHIEGLFSRADWLRLLALVGFDARVVPFDHSELEPGKHEVFVATKA
jgi:SAM-dependent methyltransferase